MQMIVHQWSQLEKIYYKALIKQNRFNQVKTAIHYHTLWYRESLPNMQVMFIKIDLVTLREWGTTPLATDLALSCI